MIPRQFRLTNSKGETLDLLNQNGAMFFEPEGLGYTEDADWLQLGTTFRPVNIRTGQRVISGKLIFLGDSKAYENYYNFVRFVRKAPLVLEYTAYDTFNIDVRVQTIEKTEITTNGCLECKVEFAALGPFYKNIYQYVLPQDPLFAYYYMVDEHGNYIVDDEGNRILSGVTDFKYDYVYPDTYPYEFVDYCLVDVDASDESPVKLTIIGPCTNPRWQHYIDGVFVASGKYNGTIVEGNRLVIDATTVPYRIYEEDENGTYMGDRYGGCDFATERFLYMAEGSNRISIAHEDLGASVPFIVEAKLCYESV